MKLPWEPWLIQTALWASKIFHFSFLFLGVVLVSCDLNYKCFFGLEFVFSVADCLSWFPSPPSSSIRKAIVSVIYVLWINKEIKYVPSFLPSYFTNSFVWENKRWRVTENVCFPCWNRKQWKMVKKLNDINQQEVTILHFCNEKRIVW